MPNARPLIGLSVLLAAALVACSVPSAGLDSKTRLMRVDSVKLDPRTEDPVLLLTEEGGESRELMIWIGDNEATSIALALHEVEIPRPNTHDLVRNLLNGIDGEIERVVVTEVRDSIYYAVIRLRVNGRTVSIDSRPSDAIAIAIRTGASVFAAESLLETEDSDLTPTPSGNRFRREPPRQL